MFLKRRKTIMMMQIDNEDELRSFLQRCTGNDERRMIDVVYDYAVTNELEGEYLHRILDLFEKDDQLHSIENASDSPKYTQDDLDAIDSEAFVVMRDMFESKYPLVVCVMNIECGDRRGMENHVFYEIAPAHGLKNAMAIADDEDRMIKAREADVAAILAAHPDWRRELGID